MKYLASLDECGGIMVASFCAKGDRVSPRVSGQLIVTYPAETSIEFGNIKVLPSARAERNQPAGRFKMTMGPEENILLWLQIESYIRNRDGEESFMPNVTTGFKKAIRNNDQDFF